MKQLRIEMPDELFDELTALSKQTGVPKAEIMRRALKGLLQFEGDGDQEEAAIGLRGAWVEKETDDGVVIVDDMGNWHPKELEWKTRLYIERAMEAERKLGLAAKVLRYYANADIYSDEIVETSPGSGNVRHERGTAEVLTDRGDKANGALEEIS
jgi:hypothetical protein